MHWEEWCFDQIGQELIPCIYWEYARESRTIRLLAEWYGKLWKDFEVRFNKSKKSAAQLEDSFRDNFPLYFEKLFKGNIDEIAAALNTPPERRSKNEWLAALPMFAATFVGRLVLEPDHFPNTPWMALPFDIRERIWRRVEPYEPVLIEERPWEEYANRPLGLKKFPDKPPEGALTPPIVSPSPDRAQIIIGRTANCHWVDVVFRIYLSEGKNDQIVSAFEKWLTRSRKKAGVLSPKRVRAAVNKAWLKRLAEMRLWKAGAGLQGAQSIIRAHIAAQNRTKPPGIMSTAEDSQLTEPISTREDKEPVRQGDSIREDIMRVRKDLRKLFGWIVPDDELPISYPFRRRSG